MDFQTFKDEVIANAGLDRNILDSEIFPAICRQLGIADDISPSRLLDDLESLYLIEAIQLANLSKDSTWENIVSEYKEHVQNNPELVKAAKLIQLNKFTSSWNDLLDFLSFLSSNKQQEL
ncbi:hypothetical protein KC678_00395 [Candidatus Dojkabacteria bacterium]|uniref:Uncharacterized protein n=1 Tax=Candidatus Dojkabacteria bacterium TaxID=2099670 RepID=A0A955IC56_9BACT|nr:hypothetical protein [Candidatus Dojkabacteria bacterium]